MLEADANLSAANRQGETPLRMSLRRPVESEEDMTDILEIMSALLEKGASPHVCNKKGQTPLLRVYSFCDDKAALTFAELLLEKGAGVNAVQNDWATALSIAKEREMAKVVKLLGSI